MRWLSDKRRATNEAELRLQAKKEPLGCLTAEWDVRQVTINRLRSAEEMACMSGR